MVTFASRSLGRSALLLGFSLGGFFDGILLHQVLQWHHLLSNVESMQDVRLQVMADGLFHALMYFIGMAGLYALWRARATAVLAGAASKVIGGTLVGFGSWHIVDAVVSHWITGIHRIKSDSLHPLAWDLGWCLVFGVLPALLGLMVKRRVFGPPGGGRSVASMLGACVLIAGPLAALPPSSENGQVVVLFMPGTRSDQAFDALASVDARVLWSDRSGGLWAVHLEDPGRAWALYERGAMLVSQGAVSLGCLSWTRPSPPALRCQGSSCSRALSSSAPA